ncbi:mucin-1-like [Poecile atricapillus]|uniref:mucin-1-like n=1 Tax=Poecile atricapillus TaxID=48891 RepID=UPI00273A116C|nr:mucin-1-like [Poecile atricapillus]
MTYLRPRTGRRRGDGRGAPGGVALAPAPRCEPGAGERRSSRCGPGAGARCGRHRGAELREVEAAAGAPVPPEWAAKGLRSARPVAAPGGCILGWGLRAPTAASVPPPAPPPAVGSREGPECRPAPRLGCQVAAGASSRRNGASHAAARSHGVRRVFSSRRELRPGSRGGAVLELWTPPCFPPCLVTFMACHGGKAEERKARSLPAARFLPPSCIPGHCSSSDGNPSVPASLPGGDPALPRLSPDPSSSQHPCLSLLEASFIPRYWLRPHQTCRMCS